MYKAIAVDDETNALDRFVRLAHAELRISSLATFTQGKDAIEYNRNNCVDIAFLDIDMPEISGIRLAGKLQQDNPYINIVFITAYDHYALEAFQVHAVHYLLKPIGESDIKELMDLLDLKRNMPRVQTKGTRLMVKCFGAFECYSDNNGVRIQFRTVKAEELFALLLQFNGAAIHKEYILDQLWSDASPKKAINNFRVTCTYLRKALNDKGYSDILCRDKESYWINMERIDCDVQKFQALAGSIAEEKSYNELDQAVQLYTSFYLGDKTYEWAIRHRQWLDNEYKRIQFLLAEEDKKQQRFPLICKRMKDVLVMDPFEEEAIFRYVWAKVEIGEVTAAKVEYQKFKKILWKEFELMPSAELTQLLETRINL